MFVALVGLSVLASAEDLLRRSVSNALIACMSVLGVLFQAARALGWLAARPLPEARLAQALPPPLACAAFAFVFAAVLSAAELAARSRGRGALGFGDVKLLASWALLLGPLALPGFAASLACAGVAARLRKQETFAYAPWLSAAYLIETCLLLV